MDRYTKTDARRKLDGLMQFLNKKHTQFDHSPSDIGSWYLDYNAIYGGGVIHEVLNEGYGVRTLGKRMTPANFCDAIDLFYELNKWR